MRGSKISRSNNFLTFPGSKIPVSYIFDYFKEGYNTTDFLSSYPWIKKTDVIKTLEKFRKKITTINAL